MEIPGGLVAVGRLHAPHGVAGQIKAECISWNPERFLELSDVVLVFPRGTKDARIVDAIPQAGGWRLSLEGIQDPESAKALSGAWICIPEAEVRRPEGGWIEADLVDLPVVDETGAVLGRALGLADIPTRALRAESSDGTEIVLPLEGAVAASVDLAGKRIDVQRELWDALL
jgi:16S rRNA processing protein RimM